MVHALGEEESVCQRQELGWYRDNAAYPNSVSAVFAAERFIVHDGRPYIP